MEWKEDKLEKLLDVLIDYRGKTPTKTDKGIPLITAKIIKNGTIKAPNEFIPFEDYDKWMVRGFPQKGDVVLTTEAPLGEVAQLYDEKVALAQRIVTLRGKKGVLDNTFLKYYFLSSKGKATLRSRQTGTTVTGIKQSELRQVTVTYPEYIHQCRIASILSSLDSKIETNNKINAELEEMAQALFKSWFVDFKPFKDGKFVDSELGMIPEGWRVFRLYDIVENISGYSYKGNELQPSTTAMATIKNFQRGGGFKIDGYKEIVISKKIKDEQYIELFDVLVAHTDLTQNAEVVGNPVLVLDKANYQKLIISMDLTKVVSKFNEISNVLVYAILNTQNFKRHALGYVNGTTVLHMKKNAVPDYNIALPSDFGLLRDISNRLQCIYDRMVTTYKENSNLSQLRDTLLPKLMNGEIEL